LLIAFGLFNSQLHAQRKNRYSKSKVKKNVRQIVKKDYQNNFKIVSLYGVGPNWTTTGYRIRIEQKDNTEIEFEFNQSRKAPFVFNKEDFDQELNKQQEIVRIRTSIVNQIGDLFDSQKQVHVIQTSDNRYVVSIKFRNAIVLNQAGFKTLKELAKQMAEKENVKIVNYYSNVNNKIEKRISQKYDWHYRIDLGRDKNNKVVILKTKMRDREK
jgi:hypothetical protein